MKKTLTFMILLVLITIMGCKKEYYTISVQSDTPGCLVSGGGSYENGSYISISAIPAEDYKFKQWDDGNTSNPRYITVSHNATYTAKFEATGNGGGSSTISTPTGLQAEQYNDGILLSWNKVTNAVKYKIYWSQTSSGSYMYIAYTGQDGYSGVVDDEPIEGYNYYKVSAVNSSGQESSLSSPASCYYSSGGDGGGTTVPNAPTGVTATNVGSSSSPQIKISWNSVSNATSYKVYRSSSSSGSYSQLGSATSNSYSYDNNPLSGYNYYKVKAVNSAGESSYSSYAYYNNTGGGTTVPNAPTGVTATNVGSSSSPQIKITWNTVSNATSYKVYRSSTASGTYSQIGTATSNTYLYDNNPMTGYNYYKVKAVNSAGESSFSSYDSYYYSGGTTVPNAPTGVTATNVGTSSVPKIEISWNSVSNATSYKVYRSSTASGTYSQIGSPVSNSYTDFSPEYGYNYYKVKAVNSAGESAFSSPVSYYLNPSSVSPCPPTVTVTGTSSQTVSWTSSTTSGCGTPTSFEVYHRDPCNGGTYELMATTTSHSYHVSSSNVHPGINRYAVKAINSSGNAVNYGYSSSVSLSKPSSFSVQKLSGGYIKFTWSAVAKATGYQIFDASSASGPYYILDQVSDGSTTTLTRYYPVSSGTTRYFKIKAYFDCDGVGGIIYSDLTTYKSLTF